MLAFWGDEFFSPPIQSHPAEVTFVSSSRLIFVVVPVLNELSTTPWRLAGERRHGSNNLDLCTSFTLRPLSAQDKSSSAAMWAQIFGLRLTKKRKISYSCRARTPFRLHCSQSLYVLTYPGSFTTAYSYRRHSYLEVVPQEATWLCISLLNMIFWDFAVYCLVILWILPQQFLFSSSSAL
jgi:hypothetical protein